MKIRDILLAFVCGSSVSFALIGFLYGLDIKLSSWHVLMIYFTLPVLSVFFLWLSEIISSKLVFVEQVSKHVLVGAFVTVFDLKFFELLLDIFSPLFSMPMAYKGISFLFSTVIKYAGNKYWAFKKTGERVVNPLSSSVVPRIFYHTGVESRRESQNVKKDLFLFAAITLAGLAIDLAVFYYLYVILGPDISISDAPWRMASVILAGLSAATFNFLGYKFLVFKK